MTNAPPEIQRIMEIAEPIAQKFGQDYKGADNPRQVWSEHIAALALVYATLLEQLNPHDEASARDSFAKAVDLFLGTLRSDPDRPRRATTEERP